MLKKLICKLFGHKFPERWGREALSLLRDGEWYVCARCGQSGFGKDPYKVFGGKEAFYKENGIDISTE